MIVNEDLSNDRTILHYFSVICSLPCALLVIIILCQMLRHFYISAIKSKAENEHYGITINKTIYYLAFIYLTSSISVLTIISFLRNNVITKISGNQYTIKQCEIGFYGVYTSAIINKSFLYLILLYRIISCKSLNFIFSFTFCFGGGRWNS